MATALRCNVDGQRSNLKVQLILCFHDLRRALRERPLRLLAVWLSAVGAILAVHCGAVSLIALFLVPPLRFSRSDWTEVYRPLVVLVLPAAGLSPGLVWASLRLWKPGRKVRCRFLLWLLVATAAYAVAFFILGAIFVRPPTLR